MPLELAQLLCTTINLAGKTSYYKSTHENHPCRLFTGAAQDNFNFVRDLGIELCKEYSFRYGRQHKCQSIIEDCELELPPGKTDFALAMPDYCKSSDPVGSYRRYYFYEKQKLFAWKNRGRPSWVLQLLK